MRMNDDPAKPSIPDFLMGGGEMGALMRKHDWAATSLGPAETWPRSLKTALRLILNTGHPMYIWWGPELLCFYNDAYSRTLGPERHPNSLACAGRDVWSEIWPLIGHQIDYVMAGRGSTWDENRAVPITRFGRLEEIYWTYSYSPIDDEAAPDGVGGVLVVCSETTQSVLSERRQSFRLSLEERLRDVVDPGEVVAVTSEALGQHLSVGQVAYAEVEPGDETVLIAREWNDGTMASNARRHRLDDFGPAFITDLKRGETIAIADVRLDSRTSSTEALATFSRASIRAFLNAPLVKAGRLVAVLAVHSATPRLWSPEEVALAEAIAEQTWAAAERARAEASLHDSEERYLALFNAIDQAFCTIEIVFDEQDRPVDYRFLEVSPSFSRQTGIANAAGRWMREIAPDHHQHWFEAYGRVASTGEPMRFENYSTPLGRWWVVYAFRISGKHRVAVLFRDITDQKRAEAALYESEIELRELNESLEQQVRERTAERNRVWEMSPDLIAVATFDGYLKSINPAWQHQLGYSHEELLTRPFAEIIHPDDLATTASVIGALARGEPAHQFLVRLLKSDGTAISYAWSAVPEAAGRNGTFYTVGRDITEDQRREEMLRQSQKMEAIGMLTGGVAHDFNNLLTPIVGSLDMLQRKGLGGEREQRLIAGAAQSAERAKTLVQRLLAFARRQPLQPVPVDLAKLVTGMGDLVASTTGPQIRVVVEAAEDLPPAKADPNQLEMAILNLAVNARDAMPDGGTLRISASREAILPGHRSQLRTGHFIRLSVADTGAGMDEATLARAVEPFFSTKGIGKGTGLGLSMVHGLASQLGGAITIQSRPGRGTNVELWLPQSATAAEADDLAREPSATAMSGTALLVDDEELVRMSTADMLCDLGYTVIEASSGEEAMRLVEKGERFDLLVTDHLMPGMNGTDLAAAVRSMKPGKRVLLVSGYGENDAIDPSLPRLTKPFRKDELAASLANLRTRTDQSVIG